MQGNLGQNTSNNGVPPSTSQQQPLGQKTPERVPPRDRNDNDQGQQTSQTGHNTPFGVLSNTSEKPMVLGQTTQTQSRVPPKCTDTGERGYETLSLAASNLFFQGNKNEVQKDVFPSGAKEDDNHSSASGSKHNEDQKYWLQSTEEYDDVTKVGPEVLSSMASATKTFWEKSLIEGKLKSKIESGKLHANCKFM